MANVKILLRENVQDLGLIGDVVEVAPGYARNYLLPRKLAVAATSENLRAMERRRARYDAEMAAQAATIQAKMDALGQVQLETSEKADDTGSLYGSVGTAQIAKLLEDAGFPTEEKDVRLDEPIKSVGTHEVPVHIHGDAFASVRVTVTPSA